MDLWTFALAFYARPGVAAACLQCQDESGADVTLLLFALWRATSGVVLSADEIAAIDHCARPWRHSVVMPLRAVRRHLKGAGAEPLRDMVKAAELESERFQLQTLEAFSRAATGSAPIDEAARKNLAAYQKATGLCLPANAIQVLLDANAVQQ